MIVQLVAYDNQLCCGRGRSFRQSLLLQRPGSKGRCPSAFSSADITLEVSQLVFRCNWLHMIAVLLSHRTVVAKIRFLVDVRRLPAIGSANECDFKYLISFMP